MKIGKKYIPPLALLLISITGVAYAALIGPQTAPAIQAKGLNSNCSKLTPSIDAVIPNGPGGAIAFDCSVPTWNTPSATFGTSAFSVAGATILTPTITFPNGNTPYDFLYIYVPNGNHFVTDFNSCTINNTPVQIWPNPVAVTFSAAGNYNYCGHFNSPTTSGLPTFSVSWN